MNIGNGDDSSTLKNPRVVWSVDLHRQFVQAVNQLGIDKAVPKKILELMNVPGLTRENVASHLNKYKFYLRRLRAVLPHPDSLSHGYLQGNPHNNPLLMHMAQSQSSRAQMLSESSNSHVSALPSPMGQLGLTNEISSAVLARNELPENGRGSGQTSFDSGSQTIHHGDNGGGSD